MFFNLKNTTISGNYSKKGREISKNDSKMGIKIGIPRRDYVEFLCSPDRIPKALVKQTMGIPKAKTKPSKGFKWEFL